jgi:release factor glutamine methyltransferase
VFAEDEADLLLAAADGPAEVEALVAARVAGSPLEHVLGWAEFCGLRIRVGPGVFVPRRRSELLVEVARDRLAEHPARAGRPVVVDLCCGTGAIGAAVAAGRAVDLYASDVDPAAVAWARVNLGGIGTALHGDLFAPLPPTLRGRVDLVVASAPYVPTDVIRLLPPEARLHEPRQALDGGRDGLDVYRRLDRGLLLLESSEQQAAVLAALVRHAGLAATTVTDEYDSTVVVGTRPAD